MKAAQYASYGDIGDITLNTDVAIPKPGPDQIRVAVRAAGINPVELSFLRGYFKEHVPLSFPATLGGDFSGVVDEVGTGVTAFAVGDKVYGIANFLKNGSGTAAEFAVASVLHTAPRPGTLDDDAAAALPLAGTSAIQALEEHIALRPGAHILIHGGAGGIGSIAIQIAKHIGATVTTTVSADDVGFVKTLGADEVIDYRATSFTDIVRDVDAVFDTVGGKITDLSLSVMKRGGILVSMSGKPDQALATEKGVTALTQGTSGNTAQLLRLKELVEAGAVRPMVDRVFDLEDTKQAYEALSGHPRGKVVIRIR